MLAVTELFGRTIVVVPFLVAIYTAYYGQGRSCMLSSFIKRSLLIYYREQGSH